MSDPASVPPPVASTYRCAECMERFLAEDLVPIGGIPVCAGCKPVAVGRLASGQPVGWIWGKGWQVVVRRTGERIVFPPRCVQCNEPAEVHWGNASVTWFRPSFSKPFVHVAWKFAMCARHYRRHWWGYSFGSPLIIGGGGMVLASAFGANMGPTMFAALAMGAGLLIRYLTSASIRSSRHTETYSWFRGCGKKFLEDLPAWPEQ